MVIRANETEEAIDVKHLPAFMRRKLYSEPTFSKKEVKDTNKYPLKSIFSNSQEYFIKKTLDQTDWNISKAAKIIGISRQSLQYHIKKHGIIKPNTGRTI